MTSIGRALGALGIVVLLMHGLIAQAAVTASLDRDRVALGDTLRLTITATDGEDLDQLDLTPLSADFEILGRSSSSKTSYINGTFSSSKELLLDITPRREGMLAIPPLRSGRQVTQGLPVAVGPPPANSLTDQTLVFEAELDRTEVYVQGQVILTLRLQQAINLDDRNITELQLDNAFVQPLEQNSFQRTINGRPWLIHEVRYAIFPEQSGTLVIPAVVFDGRMAGEARQQQRSTGISSMMERIMGRGASSGDVRREDDNFQTALGRLRHYHKYHHTTLQWLREQHVPIVNLDCEGSPESVWNQLLAIGRLMRPAVKLQLNNEKEREHDWSSDPTRSEIF